MSNKKNIDRLFQEKFKDFEVKPYPKVWQNIESKLQKEEKENRVVIIPFWLKLSGIAASLLLMLFLGKNLFTNPENSTIPNVVDIEKTDSNTTIDKTNSTVETKELKASELNSESDTSNTSSSSSTIVENENPSNTSKEEATTLQKNNSKNNYYKPSVNSSQLKSNTVVAGNTSTKNSTNNNTYKNNTSQKLNSNVVNTDSNSTNNNNAVNTDVAVQQSQNTKDNSNNTSNNLNNTISNPSNTTDVAITDVKESEKNKDKDLQEPSIEDAIAEVENNEDLIEKEKDDVTNRWSVNTNIAPVYYNVIGEGSHIHNQFNENTKSGAVNTSYGVKVGYAINDNFTLRSGISKLNLSYDTNDVVVYEKLGENSSLRNINFSSSRTGLPLNMISAKNVKLIESSRDLNRAINQQMSYYEVPVELEYKLLKKRIGINIIGGFSTFLLDDNELTSQFDGVDTKIGEANNINSVSFSTNFGIGIDYKVSKAVLLNVEPTFKYHLNAFNQTSGSFNPYILGLYTGVSYRF